MTRPPDRATSSSRGLGSPVPLDIDGVITVQPRIQPRPAVAGDAAREPSIERRLALAVSPSGRLRLLERPGRAIARPEAGRGDRGRLRRRNGRRAVSSWRRRGLHPASAGAGILPGLRAALRRPALRHRRPRGAADPRSMSRSRRACSTGSPAKRRRWPEPSTSTRPGSRRGGRSSRRSSARRSAATGAASSPTCRPRTPSGISSGASISTWRRTSTTATIRSPFSPPTRPGSRARPGRSISPSARRSGPSPGTGPRSCPCSPPSTAPPPASPLLKDLVDTGDIFQPLAWTPREAHRFLQDVPAFEAAGVIVRVPDWWRADRPRRLEVSVTVGGKPPSTLGLDALLDFSVALTLDGEAISDAEWRAILAGTDGLALVRGKWVELDREKLREVLGHWEEARRAAREGLSFREAMRLLAGTAIEDGRAGRGAGRRGRLVPGGRGGVARDHPRAPAHTRGAGRGQSRGPPDGAPPLPGRSASAGSGSSHASAWAPAWPTTWDSARRSRCWACSCC